MQYTHTTPDAITRMIDRLCAAQAASTASFEQRLIYIEDQPVKPVKRTRKRKPTLASMARQAAKAGIEVAGYEYRPDGSIRVIVGKPIGGIDTDDTASPDPKWN